MTSTFLQVKYRELARLFGCVFGSAQDSGQRNSPNLSHSPIKRLTTTPPLSHCSYAPKHSIAHMQVIKSSQ